MVKGVWLRPFLYPKVFRYVQTNNRQVPIKKEEEAAAAAKGKKIAFKKKMEGNRGK